MNDINKRLKDRFEIINSHQPVVLLNGPSIKDILKHINKLSDKKILFYAINNKFILEDAILSKINKKVDVWQVTCTIEIKRFAQEIVDFLSRKESFLFLTNSEALSKISDVLDLNKDIIDFSKIFLMDNICYNLYKTIDGNYNPSQWGKINSLGSLLSFLTLSRSKSPIYLFGCDGISESSENNENTYFHQKEVIKRRKEINNSGIYKDMQLFNEKWHEISQIFFTDRGFKIRKILNVNPNSHYTCFDLISYEDAFDKLKTLENEPAALLEQDLSDNEGIHREISQAIRNHNIHLSLNSFNKELYPLITKNFYNRYDDVNNQEGTTLNILSIKESINAKNDSSIFSTIKKKTFRALLRKISKYISE